MATRNIRDDFPPVRTRFTPDVVNVRGHGPRTFAVFAEFNEGGKVLARADHSSQKYSGAKSLLFQSPTL